MVFNSYIFWAFFVLVLLLNGTLRHRGQNLMLLAASYVFYGWWDYRFLGLMVLTTIFDYFIGKKIDQTEHPVLRKRWMLASAGMNLGLLGFFKYFNFFIDSTSTMLSRMGFEVHPWTLAIILPVGISFYTFQEMSYCIDIYKRKLKPAKSFFDFALFVSFFPQLVAGPIERATNLLPQVERPRRVTDDQKVEGLYLIVLGLFKKIVIADNMAPIANVIFASNPHTLTGPECLVGVYAFAFQIYGDFSGYSSIAQGVAKWLGFELMDNFKMPYLAVSPSDFWQRWHISLSEWLRDYLYIPLGGNRGGAWKTYRNLMLTMLLGGLWHGAAWTFVVWGLFHGALLCIYKLVETPAKPGTSSSGLMRAARVILMFHLVCVGWLLFRAESLAQAWTMMSVMVSNFSLTPLALSCLALIAFFALPLMIFEYWIHRQDDRLLEPVRIDWVWRAAGYYYCAVMLLIFPAEIAHEFIYFQF